MIIVMVRALGVSLGILDLMLTGLASLLLSIIATLAAWPSFIKCYGKEMNLGEKLIEALAGTSSSPNQVGLAWVSKGLFR